MCDWVGVSSLVSLPSPQGSTSNKFVNDGSFLQQFLKMQKEKSSSDSGESMASTEHS